LRSRLEGLQYATVPVPLTLSVIVPVFNERLTVRKLLDRVRAVPVPKEIIVVDDGSTDGTAAPAAVQQGLLHGSDLEASEITMRRHVIALGIVLIVGAACSATR